MALSDSWSNRSSRCSASGGATRHCAQVTPRRRHRVLRRALILIPRSTRARGGWPASSAPTVSGPQPTPGRCTPVRQADHVASANLLSFPSFGRSAACTLESQYSARWAAAPPSVSSGGHSRIGHGVLGQRPEVRVLWVEAVYVAPVLGGRCCRAGACGWQPQRSAHESRCRRRQSCRGSGPGAQSRATWAVVPAGGPRPRAGCAARSSSQCWNSRTAIATAITSSIASTAGTTVVRQQRASPAGALTATGCDTACRV